MNTYTIHNARLVAEPRTFNQKDGTPRLSIRVVDSPISKQPDNYKPFFVEVTVPKGLTERFGSLKKGDQVMVAGELQQRTYTSGKGDGISYEIRFPSQMLVLKQAETAEPWDKPATAGSAPADDEDLFGDE